MSRYEIADMAQEDLQTIWNYIAEDSIGAADRLLAKISDEFRNLSEMPGMGRSREEVLPGLRSIGVGNYVIYYYPIEDGIRVKRVLHGARNIENLFPAQESDE